MLYSPPTHLFDSMFVILCLIAGASTHYIANTTSTKSINQLNNHFRSSIISIILDASHNQSIRKESKTPTTATSDPDGKLNHAITEKPENQYPPDRLSSDLRLHQAQRPPTVCGYFKNLLSDYHLKFCRKHQDLLAEILPQVFHIVQKECERITRDQRWNCSGMEYLLDGSGSSVTTKEAALVRSVLSASMMYLVVKACSEGHHQSCGCNKRGSPSEVFSSIDKFDAFQDMKSASKLERASDLSKLHAFSSPHSKSKLRIQGCLANIAFAEAFTRIFVDFEEIRQLSRAQKNLNQLRHKLANNIKDMAIIKWTRSSVKLHNYNLGRQMVREAVKTRCRCHGISGVCQFNHCWDQLLDLDAITDRLRNIYLVKSIKVRAINSGTSERPDIILAPADMHNEDSWMLKSGSPSIDITHLNLEDSQTVISSEVREPQIHRIDPKSLLYLENSLDYCVQQLSIIHPGTSGRSCIPTKETNLIGTSSTRSSRRNSTRVVKLEKVLKYERLEQSSQREASSLGSCEVLCCDRGYHSELVLDLVTSNCRFKFCCQVECDKRLRQRVQHNCL